MTTAFWTGVALGAAGILILQMLIRYVRLELRARINDRLNRDRDQLFI
jgi:hypothetical protein